MKPFRIKHKRSNKDPSKQLDPKSQVLSQNLRQSSDIPDDTPSETSTNFPAMDTRLCGQSSSHLLSKNRVSAVEVGTSNTGARVRKVARGGSSRYNSIESLHQQDYLKDTVVSSSI